jgi:hypothetical protein
VAQLACLATARSCGLSLSFNMRISRMALSVGSLLVLFPRHSGVRGGGSLVLVACLGRAFRVLVHWSAGRLPRGCS